MMRAALFVAVGAGRRLRAQGSADAHRRRRSGVAEGHAHSAGVACRTPRSGAVDERLVEVVQRSRRSKRSSPRRSRTIRTCGRRPTKVVIAQQTVIVVGSRLMPWVGAQLGPRPTRRSTIAARSAAAPRTLGVAWEIDVWGRLRAQRAAVGGECGSGRARLRIRAPVARRDDREALVHLTIETRQLLALSERAVGDL